MSMPTSNTNLSEVEKFTVCLLVISEGFAFSALFIFQWVLVLGLGKKLHSRSSTWRPMASTRNVMSNFTASYDLFSKFWGKLLFFGVKAKLRHPVVRLHIGTKCQTVKFSHRWRNVKIHKCLLVVVFFFSFLKLCPQLSVAIARENLLTVFAGMFCQRQTISDVQSHREMFFVWFFFFFFSSIFCPGYKVSITPPVVMWNNSQASS